MKKTIAILSFLLTLFGASAQNVYWVFLADKAGTTFDPYSYFDTKALERYAECGADLYDMSNYPLNDSYVAGVDALATEEVGCSRWMNAVGVVATPLQADAIARLPYVLRVEMIAGNMQLAQSECAFRNEDELSTFNFQLQSTPPLPTSSSACRDSSSARRASTVPASVSLSSTVASPV